MAEKKKTTRRRPHPRLYFRLAMALVAVLMIGGLASIGWFIWTTVNDVVNRNDNSQSVKIQGVNNETLTSLEKRAAERISTAESLPAMTRDPFSVEAAAELTPAALTDSTSSSPISVPVAPPPEPPPRLIQGVQ